MRTRSPQTSQRTTDHDMQGEMITEPDTTAATSTGRGEKRLETQENKFTKKRVMMKSPKRRIVPVLPSEDPVKRRLMKKTDLKNDDSVMSVHADLLNVVNTLTKEDTAPKTKPHDDDEIPKLTVLDDHEEMKKGR